MTVKIKTSVEKARTKLISENKYSDKHKVAGDEIYINLNHLTKDIWEKLEDDEIQAAQDSSFINGTLKGITTRVKYQSGSNSQTLVPIFTTVLQMVISKFGEEVIYIDQETPGECRFRGISIDFKVQEYARRHFQSLIEQAHVLNRV
jgi:hypothetical protein